MKLYWSEKKNDYGFDWKTCLCVYMDYVRFINFSDNEILTANSTKQKNVMVKLS